MKRRAACLMACLLMCLVPLAALAAVSATPNQLLFFRTGPTVDYAPLCEMSERTALTAIEYESGSGVTWVLVEFMRNGMPERGYTGLKRMTVHGDIPWADHWNVPATLQQAAAVYAGPGYEYTPHGNLASGSGVTLLRQEGDFSFVDYIDRDGYPSRGWVESYALSSGSSYGQPSQPYGQVITYSGGTLVRVRRRGHVRPALLQRPAVHRALRHSAGKLLHHQQRIYIRDVPGRGGLHPHLRSGAVLTKNIQKTHRIPMCNPVCGVFL